MKLGLKRKACMLMLAMTMTAGAVTTPLYADNISFKELLVKTVAIIETEPNFSVNGAFHELDYGYLLKPIMKDGKSSADTMMAPLRDIFEKLAATYSYNEKTGEIKMKLNDTTLTMKVGETEAKLDNKTLKAPYAPELVTNEDGGKTLYLPVKFVFESLDANVSWDSKRCRLVATCIMTPRQGGEDLKTGGDWTFGALLNKKDSEYGSTTAKKVADNIVAFQNSNGGWMKVVDAVDMTQSIKNQSATLLKSTIDNDATITQMRYLAKVYTATGNKKYAESFMKGLNYLVDGQYDNGGWAQYFPVATGYFKNITINDNAMANVLELLLDVVQADPGYEFVTKEYADKIPEVQKCIDKGIQCILDLQIEVDGVKTAWASQYDEVTLEPTFGRAYEIPSIATQESVRVMQFLMRLEDPSKEVVEAVKAGMAWLDKVKIEGKKMTTITDYSLEFGSNRVLVDDSKSTIWARFYEIDSAFKPVFSGRDSVVKYSMEDISYERRNKYSWYGSYLKDEVKTQYNEWLKAVEK